MDSEWGRDGVDGRLYILQARPETVKASEKIDTLRRYRLKSRSEALATGRAIGQKIGGGPVRVIRNTGEMDRVRAGDVRVTDMTDVAYPDLSADLRVAVEEHSAGYPDPVTFYVAKLVEGVAT